ncbi:hypothetical protein [Phenylobacterium sp.]|uniref:hypothetical protein n=1 Tax=Phenylobacterium sp. TaxID=1871053 RepID=UPI00289AE89C|nr:hypothetical protein [Phenylobacterium sp.]
MTRIGASPFVWLKFDKAGRLDGGAAAALKAALTPDISHLVVLSHGWKNDETSAWKLYSALWPNTAPHLGAIDPARVLVAGVAWPSRRYALPVDAKALAEAASDGGGALSAGTTAPGVPDLTAAQLKARLAAELGGVGAKAAARIRATAAAYVAAPSEQTAADLVGAFIDARSAPKNMGEEADTLAAVAASPGARMSNLALPPRYTTQAGVGAVQGGLGDLGDGISDLVRGPKAAVLRLAEQFSYYEMKTRAGVVGARLGQVLGALAPAHGVKLHLAGHSFGARLVTAAAQAFPAGGALDLFSLTLLQGAFSHNGLSAARRGGFANVVGKPSGPIAISHTHKDDACTLAYALASRLVRDAALAVGDRNDRFGAMGANGAQFDPGEAGAVSVAGTTFAPARGAITNFLADGYIGDHNDVTNPTVGKLLAAAIRA